MPILPPFPSDDPVQDQVEVEVDMPIVPGYTQPVVSTTS
jgi:hypothetical protein